MPLYTVSTQEKLPTPKREEIAQMIVDTHCGLTGAPTIFVNVMFSEGIELEGGAHHLLGILREGRSDELNKEIQSELTEKVASLLGIPPISLGVLMTETPSRWTMEGGEVLPEPGEEHMSKWSWDVPE